VRKREKETPTISPNPAEKKKVKRLSAYKSTQDGKTLRESYEEERVARWAKKQSAKSSKDDKKSSPDSGAAPKINAALVPAPLPAPNAMALAVVNKGQLAIPGSGGKMDGPTSSEFDANAPGIGWAFIEFANIEGASRAKKALHGRRFGANEVEAEYFSEDKYYARDFGNPEPNQDEPKSQVGMELALVATEGENALDEAPVMAD